MLTFQELENEKIDHQEELEFLNKVTDEMYFENRNDSLRFEFKELKTRWENISSQLEERCSKMEQG